MRGRGARSANAAAIRVADLVGKARMIDMMLTGRVYHGQEAIDLGDAANAHVQRVISPGWTEKQLLCEL